MLNSAEIFEKMVAYLDLDEDIDESTIPKDIPIGPKNTPKAMANPWSELKVPTVELKPLLVGLRYAFLGPNSTYQVIINSCLSNV